MIELKNEIESCKKCKLYSLLPCGNKPIIGSGTKNAKIFFIGEAPDFEAVVLEEPIAGLNSKLLDNMLEKAKINKNDCYYTNIVHCMPTDNGKAKRQAKISEVNICQTWTVEEILAIKPKLIVGLGRLPSNYLFRTRIKDQNEYYGIIQNSYYLPCQFMCTFSPTWLLSNGKKYVETCIKHLEKAKEYIDDIQT